MSDLQTIPEPGVISFTAFDHKQATEAGWDLGGNILWSLDAFVSAELQLPIGYSYFGYISDDYAHLLLEDTATLILTRGFYFSLPGPIRISLRDHTRP